MTKSFLTLVGGAVPCAPLAALLVGGAVPCATLAASADTPTNDQLLAMMAERYARDMSNETGRVAWHGKIAQTTVTTNTLGELVKTQVYSDGYSYDIKAKGAPPLTPKVKNDLPARLKAARVRRAAELAVTNTVLITTTLKKEKGTDDVR